MEDAFLFRHGLSPSRRRPDLPGALQTVPVLLNAAFTERPEDEALVGRHARFSYEALMLASQRAAMTLGDWGVTAGDRVAACLPNETEIVVAFLAAMRIGAVFVGIPRAWTIEEKFEALRETETSLLLADQPTHDALIPKRAGLRNLAQVVVAEPGASEWNLSVDREEDLAPFDDVDPFAAALIAYQRDADGRPCGVVHSQHNLLLPGAVAAADHKAYGVRRGVCLPVSGVAGLVRGPLRALRHAGCCVLGESTDPQTLAAWIAEEDVHSLVARPSDVAGLLTDPAVRERDLASLASAELSYDLADGPAGLPDDGPAGLPDDLQARHRQRLGRYAKTGVGLAEVPGAITGSDAEDPPPEGSLGRALPHLQLVILSDDDRELPDGQVGRLGLRPAAHGPFADAWTPMLGYWNRPDATRSTLHGGTFRTGARARVDADGNLFLVP